MSRPQIVSLWKTFASRSLLAQSERRHLRSRRKLRAVIEQLEDRRLLSATTVQASSFGLESLAQGLQVAQNTYAADRVLVRSEADVPGFQQVLGTASIGAAALGQSQWWSVQLAAGSAATDVVATLRDSGFDAHLDYVVSIATHSADPDFNDANDYLYTERMQWGLNNTGQNYGGASGTDGADIKAPAAWQITTGSSDVVVAVIDSGVDYTHPDLINNMWVNPGEIPDDGIDNDGNGYADDVYGWDFYNNDADPMDDNGHGTHVAGILGAVGNNGSAGGQDGTGVAGVAWDVSIMGLKFLSASGSGYASGAIGALDYATMMRKSFNHDATTGANVRVANNSWGGGGYDAALKSAIDESGNAGILFTAAAGNGHWLFGYGLDNDASPHYPSSYDSANIVAVAATDASDQLASFSNWGATSVDLAAPGQHIWSTWPLALDTSDGTQEGYYRASGTSMATPFVSGAAALLWSANPNLSLAEVKQILMSTTDYIGNEAYSKPTVTNGRLDAHKAVSEAARLATPQLTVTDVVVVEGDSLLDPLYAHFTVTRSGSTSGTVTVDYATADSTAIDGTAATAGADYEAMSGTLTFADGETSQVILVRVHGDTTEERSETFFMNLRNPSGATLADAQGKATILDNDGPNISISDVTVIEGQSGTGFATFSVSLSKTSGFDTTISYTTVDGTATVADADYGAASGTITIPAGETAATIAVAVHGDTAYESDETFHVDLSNASNGRLTDAQGTATIVNDDAQPTGNPSDLYVADMLWAEGYTRREKYWTSVTVHVKRDADADGVGGMNDSGDEGVAQASVELLLIHDSDGNGVYGDGSDKRWTGTADTLSDGTVTFTVTKGPSSGDFRAEVTALAKSDYSRNAQLDGDNPDEYRRGVGELGAQTAGELAGESSPNRAAPASSIPIQSVDASPFGGRSARLGESRDISESWLGTSSGDSHRMLFDEMAAWTLSHDDGIRSTRSVRRAHSPMPESSANGVDGELGELAQALEARDRFFAEDWQDVLNQW